MRTAKRWHLILGLAIGVVTLAAGGVFALVSSPAALADASTLVPTSITTTSGSTGSGQKVGNLAKKDLSGRTDGWSRYVEFSGQYAGYLSYAVPSSIPVSSIRSLTVALNYRGPGVSTQPWTFQLRDWTSQSWVTIGTNATAPDWGKWTLLTFTAPGSPAGYVSSAGAIQVRLAAGNAADAADIDYAVVVLDTGASASPTASPLPSVTVAPSPSSSPTAPSSSDPVAAPSSSSPVASPTTAAGLPAPVTCSACWHPALQVSWDWVLSKVPSAPYRNVQMYDIDGFDAAAADVAALHAAGSKVVCYISVGSYENWRSDAGQFPAGILGNNLDGWPGERWLDVRDVRSSGSSLAKIMGSRLDMCRSKGFDAVEFDNMDGYTNNTGFPLTAADQAYYDSWLANGARQRGMSAVLKNDLDQISTLLPYFDMALNEQCNEYAECGSLRQVVQAGKPVFNAEYASSTSFCAADNAANFNGVNYSLNLDDSTYQPCR